MFTEPELDEDYRDVLDGVVGLNIDLYDDRSYDMVGRRIRFSEDYEPVDIVLADFDTGDIRLQYVNTDDELSVRRAEARNVFASILDDTEWDPTCSMTRREINSEDIYDTRLSGRVYGPGVREFVDEFLDRFTEFEAEDFDEIRRVEG